MSELLVAKGPLDVIRELNETAGSWDSDIQREKYFGSLEENANWLSSLDDNWPVINQEVIIYGTVLQPGVVEDVEANVGLVLGNNSSDFAVGIYRGLTILDPYDKDRRKSYRVVHVLETDVEYFPDTFYNTVKITKNSYVCAQNSTILPVEPVAHSLAELKSDEATEEIDVIAFDEEKTRLERILAVGQYVNILLGSNSYQKDKNYQRLSYLRSLGLLDGAVIEAKDFVVGNLRSGESLSGKQFSAMDKVVQIKPGDFAVLDSYRRDQNRPGHIDILSQPEAYVRGIVGQQSPVMVPFRSIVSVN